MQIKKVNGAVDFKFSLCCFQITASVFARAHTHFFKTLKNINCEYKAAAGFKLLIGVDGEIRWV